MDIGQPLPRRQVQLFPTPGDEETHPQLRPQRLLPRLQVGGAGFGQIADSGARLVVELQMRKLVHRWLCVRCQIISEERYILSISSMLGWIFL